MIEGSILVWIAFTCAAIIVAVSDKKGWGRAVERSIIIAGALLAVNLYQIFLVNL